VGSQLNLEHSLPTDEAGGFDAPRVIPERRSLGCACFAGMRIMRSFGADKYYGVDVDDLSASVAAFKGRFGP
jgi:hypothetical protein